MLYQTNKASLMVVLFAMLIMISSLHAQDMSHKKMMKKQTESTAIDVAKADINGDGNVFICSMGCAVVDTAGRCPICEMKMNEMKVADAEKMLKDKGYDVAEHSMKKKDCGTNDQKPCEIKEEVTAGKKCKTNCDKPCCAKKELAETKDCKSMKAKKCCSKADDAVSDTKPWNAVCPVMGNTVEADGPTVEYNGKIYGFCCPKCAGKFESDPAKYSKNLSEDGGKFIAVLQ